MKALVRISPVLVAEVWNDYELTMPELLDLHGFEAKLFSMPTDMDCSFIYEIIHDDIDANDGYVDLLFHTKDGRIVTISVMKPSLYTFMMHMDEMHLHK